MKKFRITVVKDYKHMQVVIEAMSASDARRIAEMTYTGAVIGAVLEMR